MPVSVKDNYRMKVSLGLFICTIVQVEFDAQGISALSFSCISCVHFKYVFRLNVSNMSCELNQFYAQLRNPVLTNSC